MNVASEFSVVWLECGAVGKVDIVVVDESTWHGYKRNVAGEAAIVEPVDADGGNAIDEPSGVDGDDDEVGARMQDGGDFAVKGRVAALVIADAFLVDPNVGAVIGRADVEETAGARLGLRLEVALIPDDALVVEELGYLGVPVAGNFERGRCGEVVLLVVLAARGWGASSWRRTCR